MVILIISTSYRADMIKAYSMQYTVTHKHAHFSSSFKVLIPVQCAQSGWVFLRHANLPIGPSKAARLSHMSIRAEINIRLSLRENWFNNGAESLAESQSRQVYTTNSYPHQDIPLDLRPSRLTFGFWHFGPGFWGFNVRSRRYSR